MRLDALHLCPYGSLLDATLGLGAGLTVVYGLNEAGKSTVLSAYADLLCGIKKTTPMDFLESRAKLRIRADVTLDDGSTVTVIRTSKNAPHDLLDAATSEPVSAAVREALTRGLSHGSLMTQFGLDHRRLVDGGEALMKGEGDLADIVFEARSGTDVRVLVDQLETRAEQLYTPRSNSKSDLVRANTAREQLDAELKSVMATAEAVEAAEAEYRRAQADLEQRQRKAADLRAERDRLNKLIAAWDYWEQYLVRRDQLNAAEAAGPRLSPDQLRTVTDAAARVDEIDEEIREQNEAADTAQRERSALAVDEKLLAAQPAVDTLNKDKHRADEARARAEELGRDAVAARAELVRLLGHLGLHDDTDPPATLAAVAVPDDRIADLNDLAAEGERLDEDMQEAQQSVNEAAAAVEEAQRAADTARPDGGQPNPVDPTRVGTAREHRDALWDHVRRSWVAGEPIPADIGSGSDDLADKYEESVAAADGAADQLAAEVGELAQEQRAEIEAAAAARAKLSERKGALSRAKQALDAVTQRRQGWQSRWQATAEAAGLPQGLGVAGWHERSALLSAAGAAAEELSGLERDTAAAVRTAADWDAAAEALACELGRSVAREQLSAWFDETEAAYTQSASNRQAAEVHRQTQDKAANRVAQLQTERTTLQESLDRVAGDHDVDSNGLATLLERTRGYDEAVAALRVPEGELRATHPGATLDELTGQLASRSLEQLKVDVNLADEALADADRAVEAARENTIDTKNARDELTGRIGADELHQDLSRATARVLDIVEEYATTRVMHHLLTQQLRVYLESHRNPVLERAGSYLSRLTGGRFAGLRADGEGTERSLVVIGADDADYETTALSEGTNSQLYLALSLAGVLEVEQERRQAGAETIPIMLDDVLMTFDDDRAASALDLLAEIGERQQVVLFTHHAAVKDRADSIAGEASVVSLDAPAMLK